MAQVGASFKITGSGKIVGAINSMICAVEDEGMYGAEFAYEEVFDAEYDDGEYDAATDALADYFDEMD